MEEKVKPVVHSSGSDVPTLNGKPGSKTLQIALPSASWNVIRFKINKR
jgi:hypothetical protein